MNQHGDVAISVMKFTKTTNYLTDRIAGYIIPNFSLTKSKSI